MGLHPTHPPRAWPPLHRGLDPEGQLADQGLGLRLRAAELPCSKVTHSLTHGLLASTALSGRFASHPCAPTSVPCPCALSFSALPGALHFPGLWVLLQEGPVPAPPEPDPPLSLQDDKAPSGSPALAALCCRILTHAWLCPACSVHLRSDPAHLWALGLRGSQSAQGMCRNARLQSRAAEPGAAAHRALGDRAGPRASTGGQVTAKARLPLPMGPGEEPGVVRHFPGLW